MLCPIFFRKSEEDITWRKLNSASGCDVAEEVDSRKKDSYAKSMTWSKARRFKESSKKSDRQTKTYFGGMVEGLNPEGDRLR